MRPLLNAAGLTQGMRAIAALQVLEILVLAMAFFRNRTDVLLVAAGCSGFSAGVALPAAIALRRKRIVLEDAVSNNV